MTKTNLKISVTRARRTRSAKHAHILYWRHLIFYNWNNVSEFMNVYVNGQRADESMSHNDSTPIIHLHRSWLQIRLSPAFLLLALSALLLKKIGFWLLRHYYAKFNWFHPYLTNDSESPYAPDLVRTAHKCVSYTLCGLISPMTRIKL